MRGRFLNYGRQHIDAKDIRAVLKVLTSDFLTCGPVVDKFEKALANYCGVKFAITCSSGTAALHLACLALGLRKGSLGITSPNTFLASANCLVYCGLRPEFADIDEETYNISPAKISKRISKNTKVIIPVHFAGQSCEMREIKQVAKKQNVFIVEDACHAIGGEYYNKMIGSCQYSDMTVFSFHPVKNLTTGEGGAITTNNKLFYERLLQLRNHGINRRRNSLSKYPGPWYYEMQRLGFNYRISDIHCALGLSQLKKLNTFVKKRNSIVARYNRAFRNLDWIKIPASDKYNVVAWHLYVLKINFQKINKSRTWVMSSLKKEGIGTQVHYIPVHLQPFYRKFGFRPGDFPVAEAYYEQCLSLPLYPEMNSQDINRVIQSVKKLFLK